ncbi:hypothetical protein [Nitrosarchaeum sp. AC2]|uniref:hypothetical protein n=1 Tax=Nitrosarchaeum sp. AC2 TaxID=2259673 RepID=UPI0015CCE564|nr:hypothetical protein [Nitrosarchaeum sp. AC2]QLH10845.1 hypothetical protein DSQ20_04685 [Nitrosarchaeum sp. AC2]
MKTRLLIIATLGIVLCSVIFYLYYPLSYNEGISITVYEDPTSYDSFSDKYSIYQLQEDDFKKIPKIKYMMDILLTRDKTVGEKHIIHLGPDNTKYEIRANQNEYSVQVGMPESELDDYDKWVEGKSTYLFEYEKVLFQVSNWKRVS